MTAEEFEAQYAANSDLTVAELHAEGMRAYPCHCDYGCCQGWQITTPKWARVQMDLGHLTEAEILEAEARPVHGDAHAQMEQESP